MNLDVSVVVPSYNNRDALELTLASFNFQTYPSDRYEVIVVDDGSSDDTEELVNSFEASYSLRYFRQRNAGRSKARNVGIRMAKGEIVILNDADGIPVPDFITQHTRYHQSSKPIVVIGGKYDLLARWQDGMPTRYLDKLLNVSGHFEELRKKVKCAQQGQPTSFVEKKDLQPDFERVKRYVFRKSHHNWDEVYEAYSEVLNGFVIPWILLVTINVSAPKALLMKVGLFDESFVGWGLEDTEIGYRLHQYGATFVYNEAAANYHQVHPNDAARRWKEHARNYIRFCEKHPTLEVFLHWRFTVGLMSATTYNEIVKDSHKYCSLGYKEIMRDYLRLSKKLAETYGQNEVFLSSFPRPVPEPLRVTTVLN